MRDAAGRISVRAVAGAFIFFLAHLAAAQGGAGERVFPQSKAAVESALKAIQPSLSGHLPVLDGFAAVDRPLEEYARGFYQASVQVADTPSGGSWVRITVKITAWHADAGGSHAGYQLLKSNGRLESDLIDQLAEQLATAPKAPETQPEATPAVGTKADPTPPATQPSAAAPATKFPDPGRFSSSVTPGLVPDKIKPDESAPEKPVLDKPKSALEAEANGLEEILKNQAHPKNLVAVKKSGTPVVGNPSLTAKPLFLASMHDEFEMLDFNEDWVHVRISGLSRGWIWRNSLEMPEGVPDTTSHSQKVAGDLFHVTREEDAPFPGDWAPLRGKNVKIISVQKVDENARGGGAEDKLEYTKYLLDKSAPDLAKKTQALEGIVVIFDSSDGGMIAASTATVQQWKSGSLSDSALWHHCFFDPPETFTSAPPSGAQ
ncbi:MAG TPA: hypothetical protein VKV39_03915 [Candidatus Sulfotelmatobacter sp.]|nr:hypothetical protein [Candidatus Sulfotelmatobacter sp.]